MPECVSEVAYDLRISCESASRETALGIRDVLTGLMAGQLVVLDAVPE